jgi:hypothetical protein
MRKIANWAFWHGINQRIFGQAWILQFNIGNKLIHIPDHTANIGVIEPNSYDVYLVKNTVQANCATTCQAKYAKCFARDRLQTLAN